MILLFASVLKQGLCIADWEIARHIKTLLMDQRQVRDALKLASCKIDESRSDEGVETEEYPVNIIYNSMGVMVTYFGLCVCLLFVNDNSTCTKLLNCCNIGETQGQNSELLTRNW